MPMRDQPEGVHRVRRGTERPAREYDIVVDGDQAGVMERLPHGEWRARRDGHWPQKFGRPGAYLAGVGWITDLHRKAKAAAVAAPEPEPDSRPPSGMSRADPADPFWGDPFADPLTLPS